MTMRATSLGLVMAAAAVLEPLPRAGKVITDPIFSVTDDTPAKRFGLFRGLVKGKGWIVEAAGQEPRERTPDGSSGFETLTITAILDYLAAPHAVPGEPEPDASSHVFFDRMTYEAEVAFENKANASLGLPPEGTRQFLLVSPIGPFRLDIDAGDVIHVREYQLRVFTSTC